MILQDIYLKTFEKFERLEFGIPEFSKLHKTSSQSAKVLLHRMKQNCQLFSSGWGKYVLLSPKHWIVLQELKRKPRLYSLAITLYEMFPKLSLLLLYGSQVRGDSDQYSDYDVLLVLEKQVESKVRLKEQIEQKLKIRLHLTIYSEPAFKTFAISEPYLRFWFSEGILFDEKRLVMQLAKPVAKIGYLENLQEAKTYLGLLRMEHDATKRARYAFTALRISLLVEHALGLDYNYDAVSKELLGNFGESITRIRAKKPIPRKELNRLEHVSKAAFLRVGRKLDALGDNESDIYWKKTWVVGGKLGSEERT